VHGADMHAIRRQKLYNYGLDPPQIRVARLGFVCYDFGENVGISLLGHLILVPKALQFLRRHNWNGQFDSY
jgi:hypothetical protein